MSKKTMSRVLAELKTINTQDLFVSDVVKICITLLEADLTRHKRVDGLPPHQWHSDTSRASAEAIAPKFGKLTHSVLLHLSRFPNGLTDEESQNILGMQGNSYRPCRVTLMDRGYVVDSGQRRKTAQRNNAVVWTLTQSGFLALEK